MPHLKVGDTEMRAEYSQCKARRTTGRRTPLPCDESSRSPQSHSGVYRIETLMVDFIKLKSLNSFNHHRDGLAAADAERGDPLSFFEIVHGMNKRS